MSEKREDYSAPVERLAFFSDAAVAIALTLLILPLTDGVSQAARSGHTVVEFLRDNLTQLVAFALSFVLIARFWRAHHRLFALIERETAGLFWLNMGWLLAIVFLPVATATTGALPTDAAQYCLYIGTMIAVSVLMTAMTVLLARHPETWAPGAEIPASKVRASITMVALLSLALGLALTVPGLSYWSLLVLFAARPVAHLLRRATNSRSQDGETA